MLHLRAVSLLFGLWLSHWLTLVLATEFYADDSFDLAEDLIVRNALSELVLVDDLRLLANLSCQLFLSHSFLVSSFLDELSNIHTESLASIHHHYR